MSPEFTNSRIFKDFQFTRRKVGTLIYGRHGHGAIFDGEKFLIIGGMKSGGGAVNNEVCTLEGSKMTCVDLSTWLDRYDYPELFLVADNFVNRC